MSKLKGRKALTKVVNEFVEQFGVTAKFGKEFQAVPAKNRVDFTLAENEEVIKQFMKNAEMRFPQVHAHPFIWLLLHEIGHMETVHYFTIEEQWRFIKKKKKLYKVLKTDDYALVSEWYQLFPDEYMATLWAGNYMMEHTEEVAKFNKKLNKAIMKFYEKNGITP